VSKNFQTDVGKPAIPLLPASNGSATRYEYGTLTEDFLKALPAKPMSLGEFLCGDSKPARRCRQLGAAYGSISGGAMAEAMKIKYQSPNVPAETPAKKP